MRRSHLVVLILAGLLSLAIWSGVTKTQKRNNQLLAQEIKQFLSDTDNHFRLKEQRVYVDNYQVKDELRAKLLVHFALTTYYNGNWQESATVYQEIKQLYDEFGTVNDSLYLMLYIDMSRPYLKLDNCLAAHKVLDQAWSILSQTPNNFSPTILEQYYEQLSWYYRCTNDLDQAKAAAESALEAITPHKKAYPLDYGRARIAYGKVYRHFEQYDEAIEQYYLALTVFAPLHKDGDGWVATVYDELGFCYNQVHQYHLAIEYLNQAIDMIIDHADPAKSHPGLAAFYRNIATSFGALGDIEREAQQLEQALRFQNRRNLSHTIRTTRTLVSLANNLIQRKKYTVALDTIEAAWQLEQNNGRAHHLETMPDLHILKAKALHYLNRQREAERVLKAGLRLSSVTKPMGKVKYWELQEALAEHYHKCGRWQDALSLYDEIITQSEGHDYTNTAQIHLTKSAILLEQKEVQRSLAELEKVMPFNRITVKQQWDKYKYTTILKYYNQAADIFYTKFLSDQQDSTLLQNAIISLEQASKWISENHHLIQNKYYLIDAFRSLQTKLLNYYDQYFDYQPNENQLNRILQLFEQTKATTLISRLPVPEESKTQDRINEQRRLQQKIKALESRFINAVDFKTEDYKEVFALLAVKDSLRVILDENRKTAFDQPRVKFSDLQAALPPNQTLVTYHWAEDWVRGICISKTEVNYQRLVRTEELSTLLKKFLPIIHQPLFTGENNGRKIEAYIETATELNCLLLAPFTESQTNSLIIIPDGALTKLPFAALLTEQPGDQSRIAAFPFLIKRHSLSYQYSARLWQKKQPFISSDYQWDYVGFAPFFSRGSTFSPIGSDKAAIEHLSQLALSKQELAIENSSWRSKIYLDQAAHKDTVITNLAVARVVHFFTHAKLNTTNELLSALYLQSDRAGFASKLYTHEVLASPQYAELVLLSACHSGGGQFIAGEGLIGLTYAFHYAGVQATCSSLWELKQAAAIMIIDRFMVYLRQGENKANALRQAQLDYLKEYPSNNNSFPYMWSSWVLFGNMSPIL